MWTRFLRAWSVVMLILLLGAVPVVLWGARGGWLALAYYAGATAYAGYRSWHALRESSTC
jgi:hypothetical protein